MKESENLGGHTVGTCNGVLQVQEAPIVIVFGRIWASVKKFSPGGVILV